MKYEHTVKFNGKWYRAGEEVPEAVPDNTDGKHDEPAPKRTRRAKAAE